MKLRISLSNILSLKIFCKKKSFAAAIFLETTMQERKTDNKPKQVTHEELAESGYVTFQKRLNLF